MSDVERYPLAWPHNWPRTSGADRRRATFSKNVGTRRSDGSRITTTRALSVADAALRLQREIDRLGGDREILSTNVRLRMDGVPRGDQEPSDPGAAVYFQLGQRSMVLACDRWTRVADNIAALAAHIDALRRIDRYGVGSLEQAFTGYLALQAKPEWWQVLQVTAAASLNDIERAYRQLAMTAHPDRGGSHDTMAQLNEARQAAHRARSRA
jgi:hypothetical protein